METERTRKVGIAIQKEFSEILQREVKDPRIGLVTVTRVKVTPDLRIANIYISIYGSAEERERTLQGLESAKGYIRSLFAKRLHIKFIPEIRFFHDKSIEEGIRISEVVSKLKNKDDKKVGKEEKEEKEEKVEKEEKEEEENENENEI